MTTATTMQDLYNSIDREARDYIWGGCALDEHYKPYSEDFTRAAALIAEYDRDESLSDPETGYTPEGDRLTEKVVAELCDKILPMEAVRVGVVGDFDAKDLYVAIDALTDRTESWDVASESAYRRLAYLLDLEEADYESYEELMNAAKKAMEAAHE